MEKELTAIEKVELKKAMMDVKINYRPGTLKYSQLIHTDVWQGSNYKVYRDQWIRLQASIKQEIKDAEQDLITWVSDGLCKEWLEEMMLPESEEDEEETE